jgi:uncharacterized membrane protein YhiD involved in acid resistance
MRKSSGMQLLHQDFRIKQSVDPGFSNGLLLAALILFAAAVGVCVALSQLVLAVGVTVLVLITLRIVGRAEKWLEQRRS